MLPCAPNAHVRTTLQVLPDLPGVMGSHAVPATNCVRVALQFNDHNETGFEPDRNAKIRRRSSLVVVDPAAAVLCGVRKVTPAACSDALCERDGEMSGASSV